MGVGRTDLLKMGRHIAELRKEKNYTQVKLGELIDVDNKTISKWENGVIAPDISILRELANVFDVTVDEILCGEKISIDKDIQKKNFATIFGINLYVKEYKKRVIKLILLFSFVIFTFIFCYLYVDNYYKWNIHCLGYVSDDYNIAGTFISNYEEGKIILDKFDYVSDKIGTIDEPKIIKLKLTIFYGDKELISDERIFDAPIFLNLCLDNYVFIYESKELTSRLKYENLNINISYIDDKNEFHNVVIKQ